jgi:hypothetical protein
MLNNDSMEAAGASSILTPGLSDSFLIGLLGQKHEHGLQSGGLFGYSTVFTGVGPGASRYQRYSLGLGALKAVSLGARGLQLTGLGEGPKMGRFLSVLADLPETGIAGAVGSYMMVPPSALTATQDLLKDATGASRRALTITHGSSTFIRFDGEAAWRQRVQGQLMDIDPSHSDYDFVQKTLSSKSTHFDEMSREVGARIKAHNLGREIGFADDAARQLGQNKWVRFFGGWLGGKDVAAADGLSVTMRGGRPVVRINAAKSGYTILSGRKGQVLGRALKGVGWLEAAGLAADALSYVAGEAYGALSRVTGRMAAAHNPHTMSAGYFNQAAASSRARAVSELNSSLLNPRTQLMGNEAYFYHR